MQISLLISFLLKFISKGVDISISFTENVFAWLFPVEKKIFIKARNKKKLYKSFKLLSREINFIKHINE